MYVIVIGGGRVGYQLARHLLDRGEEVTLIEKDGRRAEWLEGQLGSIVMTGDGDEMAFLETTGIERAGAIGQGSSQEHVVLLAPFLVRLQVEIQAHHRQRGRLQ